MVKTERVKSGRASGCLIKAAIVIAALVFIFVVVMLTITSINARGDIRDQERSFGFFPLNITGETIADRYNLSYYHSIEAAIITYYNDVGADIPIPQIKNEIIRFEKDQYLLVIIAGETVTKKHGIYLLLFSTDGDRISYPLYVLQQSIDKTLTDTRGRYYDEDRVARDILWSYTSEHVTEKVNGGKPIYYGVGLGDPPAYLSVLGHEPDAIIPFSYAQNEYFFWYYSEAAHLSEVFSENFVELSEGSISIPPLTLGEIIDIFEITIFR